MFLETVNHWIGESAAICHAEPECSVLVGLGDWFLIPDQSADEIHPY